MADRDDPRVDLMLKQAEAMGVEVSDADIAKRIGDDEVESARKTAEVLREPLLKKAGWEWRAGGQDGLGMWDHRRRQLRLICSIAREDDGEIWAHLSASRADRKVPSWDDLAFVKESVFPDRVALQVLPPQSEWYTIQEDDRMDKLGPKQTRSEVLHLWVCLSRRPTPDFRGAGGTL